MGLSSVHDTATAVGAGMHLIGRRAQQDDFGCDATLCDCSGHILDAYGREE